MKPDLREDVCELQMLRDQSFFLVMDSASRLACSLIRAHPKRGVCIRAKEGNGERKGEGLCHDIYSACLCNQCFSDGLYPLHDGRLSPSVPRAVDPKPNLAAQANSAVNGLPEHAVVRHLLSVVQAGTND